MNKIAISNRNRYPASGPLGRTRKSPHRAAVFGQEQSFIGSLQFTSLMSSIGIIFREDKELTTLPSDWTPVPLGARAVVIDAVERALAGETSQLSLRLTVESVDESPDPRTISAAGVWGPRESAVIRAICRDLAARFYDAETAEFIEL